MAEARIQPNYRLVGTRVPRHDAIAKSRGLQRYSDDIDVTQMLYAKVKRSEYPAAILRGVDTSKAKALPGVKAVITADDVPVNAEITKFGQMRDVGGGFEGLYKALASGKVRWKGDPMASRSKRLLRKQLKRSLRKLAILSRSTMMCSRVFSIRVRR